MLDLLAAVQSVDPLSLPLWVIAAFAAGMYPVGFLFGFGCSACCEEDPCAGGCTRCTRWHQNGEDCPDNWTVVLSVDGHGSVTCQDVPANGSDLGGCAGSLTGIPFSVSCGDFSVDTANVEVLWIENVGNRDECGCRFCEMSVVVRVFAFPGSDFSSYVLFRYADISNIGAVVKFKTCTDNNLSADLDEQTKWMRTSGSEIDCLEEFSDALVELGISITLSVEECECGACCDGDCEDDVASGACSEWAGIGTSCDDDPGPCEA